MCNQKRKLLFKELSLHIENMIQREWMATTECVKWYYIDTIYFEWPTVSGQQCIWVFCIQQVISTLRIPKLQTMNYVKGQLIQDYTNRHFVCLSSLSSSASSSMSFVGRSEPEDINFVPTQKKTYLIFPPKQLNNIWFAWPLFCLVRHPIIHHAQTISIQCSLFGLSLSL